MRLHLMVGNGKFLLNNRLDLCPEIIHTGKENSKRHDVWLACQISENQDKNDISNQIEDSMDWVLETDNDLAKHGQQTTISVTKTDHTSHRFLPTIKSHLK